MIKTVKNCRNYVIFLLLQPISSHTYIVTENKQSGFFISYVNLLSSVGFLLEVQICIRMDFGELSFAQDKTILLKNIYINSNIESKSMAIALSSINLSVCNFAGSGDIAVD